MAEEKGQGFYVSEFSYRDGLNYDDTLLAVQKNQAIGALNISTIDIHGQGDGSAFAIKGNSLAFTLPTVATQNKIYSIQFTDTTVGNVLSVQFLNLNGSQFRTPITPPSYTVVSGNSLSTITTNFASDITSALTAGGFTSVVDSTVPGTITVQLVPNSFATGFDYILSEYSTNTEALTITTIQESIDNSLSGLCLPIGGIDYLGDLFIFSSSVMVDSTNYSIVSMQASGSGEFQLNVTGDITRLLNPSSGDSVTINGVITTGSTTPNGVWINGASSYNSGTNLTTITLRNSTYSAGYVSEGTITLNANGYLSVTVNKRNNSTGVWTTTELLGTKSINSRFTYPIRKEINANKNNDVLAIYFTDGYDFPRIFEYTGSYMTNGGIEYYNPLGFYTYDGVGLATRNIQNAVTPIVQPTSVNDVGGAIMSGNWRYAVIPLDSSLTPSQVSILSNPVNIYNGSFGNPSQIVGTPGVPSSMQVTVTVTDIPENVYSYIDLIGINYVGSTETAYLIKQVPIPPDTTTMTITHTGLETLSDYTNGFVLNSLTYIAAGTQTICSNTLLYGDLTAAAIDDFTAFSQTFTHVLNKEINLLDPLGDDVTGFTLGEYQIPIDTAQYTGYMLNETYRFWACYELINGGFTPLFWIDDIRFDAFATNRANPFGDTGRRTANSINNYDLSESPGPVDPAIIKSYVFSVTFNNTNPNYLVDGQPMSSLVSRIHIFRTDNSALNEVLGCGLTVRHVSGYVGSGLGATPSLQGVGSAGTNYYLFENPFLFIKPGDIDSFLPGISLGGDATPYASAFPSSGSTWKYGTWDSGGAYASSLTPGSPYLTYRSGSFYCPDWIYGQINIIKSDNDSIFNYGQPEWHIQNGAHSGYMDSTSVQTVGSPATIWLGTEFRLSGATSSGTNDPVTDTAYNLPLSTVLPVPEFSPTVITDISTGYWFCPQWQAIESSGNTYSFATPSHLWVFTGLNFQNNNSSTNLNDVGMYYCQYYRNLGSSTAYTTGVSKFGSITQGSGIPTGVYIDVTPESTILTANVFGGDTFNQKSFLKILVPNNDTNGSATFPEDTGGGVTAVFVCQNRMNYNMRDGADGQYPASTPQSNWINDTTDSDYVSDYYQEYTPRNPDNTLQAYNPAFPYTSDLPERIMYSLVQPQNSVINNYRIFPPLNFYDLSSDKGIITNLTTLQGELYSLQQKEFARQFYNERGSMNVDEASTEAQVQLGSGTPFNVPGVPVSPNIGNSNNHGLLYGTGLQGEDIRAFIDTITRQVIIVSSKGFEIVSLTKKMRSFFENNLQYITDDNPDEQNGITGVWNDKKKEFIWTVFNIIDSAEWSNTVFYNAGLYVYYGTTFEGFPIVYKCILTNEGFQPDISPSHWQIVQNSVYTIIYNTLSGEANVRGRFTSFLTPCPYFYVEWENTYLTGYPNIDTNTIWEDNLGPICTWYDTQIVNGSLSFVTNDLPDASKAWVGTWWNSTLIPYYLLFTTQLCSSYLPNSDFDWMNENNDGYYNAIQNDTISAPNNTPQEDSTPVYGSYMITTVTFLANTIQNVFKVLTKWKPLSRTPNK